MIPVVPERCTVISVPRGPEGPPVSAAATLELSRALAPLLPLPPGDVARALARCGLDPRVPRLPR